MMILPATLQTASGTRDRCHGVASASRSQSDQTCDRHGDRRHRSAAGVSASEATAEHEHLSQSAAEPHKRTNAQTHKHVAASFRSRVSNIRPGACF